MKAARHGARRPAYRCSRPKTPPGTALRRRQLPENLIAEVLQQHQAAVELGGQHLRRRQSRRRRAPPPPRTAAHPRPDARCGCRASRRERRAIRLPRSIHQDGFAPPIQARIGPMAGIALQIVCLRFTPTGAIEKRDDLLQALDARRRIAQIPARSHGALWDRQSR